MAKRTPATASVASTPTATATPKFRAVDALQLSTHIKKMDSIHIAKSTPRKFENFVNLSVDEIADILTTIEIDNVNNAINVFVNLKSPTAVLSATADEIATATVRKK